jgi:hypothetical protein
METARMLQAYEAIGMGTMPITELDPILFRHIGSNVIQHLGLELDVH